MTTTKTKRTSTNKRASPPSSSKLGAQPITIKQAREIIQDSIRKYPVVAMKALRLVGDSQTDLEKSTGKCLYTNGVGFSKHDSQALTKIYKKLVHNKPITDEEIRYVQKRISYYWRQLLPSMEKRGLYTLNKSGNSRTKKSTGRNR